jgi:hypothetical protein
MFVNLNSNSNFCLACWLPTIWIVSIGFDNNNYYIILLLKTNI